MNRTDEARARAEADAAKYKSQKETESVSPSNKLTPPQNQLISRLLCAALECGRTPTDLAAMRTTLVAELKALNADTE